MADRIEYRFTIDACSRDTLPMARLAEYMADLAKMLGEEDSVHFDRIEDGSLTVVKNVDRAAEPALQKRIVSLKAGDAPSDAMQAFGKINTKLRQANSVGTLTDAHGAELLFFPGRDSEEPPSSHAFDQYGSLDGVVIVVGGRNDPVPVRIQRDENVYKCRASRELAAKLGEHLFDVDLRVWGTGRWSRETNGSWLLHRFEIESFDILDRRPLDELVQDLRAGGSDEWHESEDIWNELMEIRGTDDETE